jgi:voltage-gated potassium channel
MTMDPDAEAIPWNSQTEDGQVLLGMPWEIFVLGCALLSILNLVLAIVIRTDELVQVVTVMDGMLVIVFAIDFARRLRVAHDDRAYFIQGRGWLDLVSIIPALRIARVLRILRVTRIVRRMGGLERALVIFFMNRATGGLLLVLLIAILVLEFGSLAILWAERPDPAANITTAGDALWYVIVTMSTVGYGDQYPVTEIGRTFGVVIIVVGVGVFGTLTGFLANAFLSPSDAAADHESEATPERAPVAEVEA